MPCARAGSPSTPATAPAPVDAGSCGYARVTACALHISAAEARVRKLESSLQQFGEFLLKARLVKDTAAPYCVRFVRQFLTRPANDGPRADRVQQFCEHLERAGAHDWQVHQAEPALRIYFVNFLNRTDWRTGGAQASIDAEGRVDPLPALEALRARIRTRHYSYRTECSYVDWVRRAHA